VEAVATVGSDGRPQENMAEMTHNDATQRLEAEEYDEKDQNWG